MKAVIGVLLVLLVLLIWSLDFKARFFTTEQTSTQEILRFDDWDEYATSYRVVRPWKKQVLTYRIESYPRNLSRRAVQKVIQRAFSAWSEASKLTFEVADEGETVDIVISWEAKQHGHYDFDGPSGVLAHAEFPSSGVLHFDADENWGINSNRVEVIDVFTVALHEIGHLLGVGHSDVYQAIMYPLYKGRITALHSDDIAAAKSLYSRDEFLKAYNPSMLE